MAASGEQPTPPPAPKTRLGLSLAERIKVIEARQMGKSMRQLAAQFGCGKTQILNTLAQKDRYTREWELMGRNNPSIGARKRFRHTRNEQINRSVHEWYQEQAASGLRVTGPMLQKQARHYAAHLGIVNFAASNGWLANFRRFYNIISCSPHPRKRRSNIPEHSDKLPGGQQPSTSTYHLGAEFVHTSFSDINKKSPQSQSESDSTIEKDPLEVGNKKEKDVCAKIQVKVEPSTDDDDSHTTSEENYSLKKTMSSIPLQNSPPAITHSPPSHPEETASQAFSVIKPNQTSQSFINLRKRRLLQSEVITDDSTLKSNRPEAVDRPLKSHEEKRLPDLQPLTPFRACIVEFVNLARSKGMTTITMRDDLGNEWLEVRPSVATYRVPQYGYPTQLARLIVDASLEYYLEVLGHCVRKGSLLLKDTSSSFNYSEAVSIVCSLNGGHVVCSGIEMVFYRVSSLHMRTVLEIGQAENMYVTLPDYRYRSNDCLIWIDHRFGPRCPACKEASGEYSSRPIDLRCSTATHHSQHEH